MVCVPCTSFRGTQKQLSFLVNNLLYCIFYFFRYFLTDFWLIATSVIEDSCDTLSLEYSMLTWIKAPLDLWSILSWWCEAVGSLTICERFETAECIYHHSVSKTAQNSSTTVKVNSSIGLAKKFLNWQTYLRFLRCHGNLTCSEQYLQVTTKWQCIIMWTCLEF